MCSRETFYWPHVSTYCTRYQTIDNVQIYHLRILFFLCFIQRRWEWIFSCALHERGTASKSKGRAETLFGEICTERKEEKKIRWNRNRKWAQMVNFWSRFVNGLLNYLFYTTISCVPTCQRHETKWGCICVLAFELILLFGSGNFFFLSHW